MQTSTKIILPKEETVGGMALEIVPDLFHWIELRSVTREVFKVKAREILLNSSDSWTFVDPSIIPHNNDVTGNLSQQTAKEPRGVSGLEIPGLKGYVETDVVVAWRYSEASKSRDAVVTVVVTDDRRLAFNSPGPSTSGDEQKPALIQERQVGAKSLPFFLARAIYDVSTLRWPLRPAELHVAPEPGNSNQNFGAVSRYAQCDTGYQTPSLSHKQFSSESRSHWETQRHGLLSAIFGGVPRTHRAAACEDGQEPVLVSGQRNHLGYEAGVNERWKRSTSRFGWRPLLRSDLYQARRWPSFVDVPKILGNHVVS